MPGEHRLAFYFNSRTRMLEYFDSFALPAALHASVHASLVSQHLLQMCVNADTCGMLQSTSSTVCGHYSVMYLLLRSRSPRAPLGCVSQQLACSAPTADLRDVRIVTSIRNISARHPCCSAALTPSISHGNQRHSHDTSSHVSQTCCCSKFACGRANK
jgi:hypothetical protein